MAPINEPTWSLLFSLQKHSLFRRDITDGTLLTLIIATTILFILVVGIICYLFRRTWAKVIEPFLNRHRSSRATATTYKLPSIRPHFASTKSEAILPTYRQSMHGRSESDALWSAHLDQQQHEMLHSSSEEDCDDYLPRYSSRKFSPSHHRNFLSVSLTGFRPLEMHTIQESVEQPSTSSTTGSASRKPARPGMRRAMSETQVPRTDSYFDNVSTSNRSLMPPPLRSHPVGSPNMDFSAPSTPQMSSSHRCSGSVDNTVAGQARRGNGGLTRQRSMGKVPTQLDFL